MDDLCSKKYAGCSLAKGATDKRWLIIIWTKSDLRNSLEVNDGGIKQIRFGGGGGWEVFSAVDS